MKKLLLVVALGFAPQTKAMNHGKSVIKDSDFSKKFFNELEKEYNTQQYDLAQDKNQLTQQRNSLETNLNLKKLNLNIKEKSIKKREQSASLFTSFVNVLDAGIALNEWISIQNDMKELSPIQAKLIAVTSESLSNLKCYAIFQGLKQEYPEHRTKNPYLKKITTTNPFIEKINKKESRDYDEALFSLKVTKKVMEHNLSNVSWFQWLWNYSAYKNYQKSIQALDDEIVLFKEQDRIVSPEKSVTLGKQKNIKIMDRSVTKSQLTHREVFTRSNMPQYAFEQVKRDRE